MPPHILLADDDSHVLVGLSYLLEAEGYRVSSVTTPKALLASIAKQDYALALVDMNFQLDTTSGQEGLALIEAIRQQDEHLPVIMLTGWATIELAVNALKLGANDFLQKPWDDQRLLHGIKSQLNAAKNQRKVRQLSAENHLLKQQNNQHPLAVSTSMQGCLGQLKQLAQSEMNILLTGENGTGKSLLANYVHQHSPRAAHSFVAVNMGAIADTLFESEFFGHVKGAFTDAKSARLGRFAMAEGGSLFLDEIANIPLNQQAKLLRVLEAAQYEPVGSSKTHQANVRIISATNGDLRSLMQSGAFRQDLFYRLNTVNVHIPALRERSQDILPLAEHFLASAASKYHKPAPQLSSAAQHALLHYSWPGNVRELSHVMERALFTCIDGQITPGHLALQLEAEIDTIAVAEALSETDPMPSLQDIEKHALLTRLAQFNGNVSQAAKSLGLSRSGWYRRAEKFDLK